MTPEQLEAAQAAYDGLKGTIPISQDGALVASIDYRKLALLLAWTKVMLDEQRRRMPREG